MLETKIQKITVTLGTILLLAILGYFLWNNASSSSAPLDTSGQPEVLGQDILDLANKVDTISIDQSVFSSNVFSSLVDHAIPLAPEVEGRPNPFATIGNDTGAIGNSAVPSTSKATSKP